VLFPLQRTIHTKRRRKRILFRRKQLKKIRNKNSPLSTSKSCGKLMLMGLRFAKGNRRNCVRSALLAISGSNLRHRRKLRGCGSNHRETTLPNDWLKPVCTGIVQEVTPSWRTRLYFGWVGEERRAAKIASDSAEPATLARSRIVTIPGKIGRRLCSSRGLFP
jgi:hypothetical protein